ncbi:hypothetical protein ABPG74_005933 [Tetrahymena malaccensis]
MNQSLGQSCGNIIRSIDIFGQPIQINFKQNTLYKTKCGGVVSLILLCIIVAFSISILIQMIQKQDPQIIQQNQIKVPDRVNLNRNNFIFAFGLIDEDYNPYMDDEIYSVNAKFTYKKPVQNDDGTIAYSFISVQTRAGPCNQDLFGIVQLQKYFTEIKNYQQLYCLLDIDQIYLEGQFEADQFSTVQIHVYPCFQQGCKDKDYVTKKIKNSTLQIYFSNNIVKPFDFNNPFEPFGQSAYYYVNLNQLQLIQFTYMNTHVIDDLGLITSSIKQQNQLIFSQNLQSTTTDISQGIFQVGIYLEKNKEQYVNRSYTKVVSAISQIGGLYNVLIFIGCILTKPFSFLLLNRDLINQTFSFDFQSLQSTKKKLIQDHPENSSSSCFKRIKNKFKSSKKMKKNSKSFEKNDLDQIQNEEIKINEKQNSTPQGFSVQQTNLKSQLFEKLKQGISCVSNLTISTLDYMLFYFKCLKSSELNNLLSYSTKKIEELTDITFILDKLIELEKLKHLLLNENQLKLFEYIPKPKITKDIINIYSNNQISPQKEISKSPPENKTFENSEFNLLATLKKTKGEIDMQGQIAYYQINNCQNKLSKIDRKLLSLLGKDTQKMLKEQKKNPIILNIIDQTQNSPDKIFSIGNSANITSNVQLFKKQPENKNDQLQRENFSDENLEEQRVHPSQIQQINRNMLTEGFNKNVQIFTKKKQHQKQKQNF